MSKHYDERYVRTYGSGDYDYKPRRRSSSRSRHERYDDGANYVRSRYSRSNSGSSLSSVSDYEYRGHYVSSERPIVRLPRDVIRAPTPPPVIQRVVERAPTPEPDILERVIVRPQPQQLIERIIERPATPPPKIIDKEITEPAPPPIVRTRVVKVDSRSYARAQPQIAYTQQYSSAPIVQRPVTYSRPALSSYGYQDTPQYVDYYNYGPERSYSTTYSTNELMPASVYVPQPAPAAPAVSYNQGPMGPASGVYPGYNTAPSAAAYPSYGYSYGYRPVYNPVQGNQYPRAY